VLNPPTACAAFPIGVMCSMPPLLGITYTKIKALPKIFRECLISGMQTNNHMGLKLKQEALRLKLKPAQVAAVFGVKAPSVYDWYEHGRIHKKHYPRLVEWSGKSLEWWLGFEDQNQQYFQEALPAPSVQKQAAVFSMPQPKQDPLIIEIVELFSLLDKAAKIECLNYVRGFVDGHRPHAHGPASAMAG